MKKNLHPNWNHQAKVTCSCGNTFTTGSISNDITVEICNACHPFFTGEMKFIDVQGRVDKFKSRMQQAQKMKQQQKKTSDSKQQQKQDTEKKSLKQMLQEERAKIAKQEKKGK